MSDKGNVNQLSHLTYCSVNDHIASIIHYYEGRDGSDGQDDGEDGYN